MSKSSEEGNGSGQDGGVNVSQKDANGNLYDNRAGTKKIIRVVTVMAYVFSVSFAAILLSAYYVFLWEPPNPRLQRHPLSGDPQVEFLMDNILSRKNYTDINNDVNDDHLHSSVMKTDIIEEYENPSKKFNNILFERIMTSDHEKPRRNEPQKLIAFQDFAVSRLLADADVATTTIRPEDPGIVGSVSTYSLPIFFKTLGKYPTILTTPDDINGDNKGKNIEKFKNPMIEEGENIKEKKNESNSETEIIMNNETTFKDLSELDTLDVMSTWDDLQTTIYPRIDNLSYHQAIGTTVQNNKGPNSILVRPPATATTNNVTIGTDSTIETSTSPSRITDLDQNFDIILRKEQDSRSTDYQSVDIQATKNSEVQIYPEDSDRDIIDDRN